MIKTYQGTVYPWNCDHMNHMNVQFYVGKFDQATWNLFSLLGLTSSYMKESNTGLVALEQNLKYLKECIAGDNLFIESEIQEIKGKIVRFKHIMSNLESKSVVAESELVGLHIDTVLRKGIAVPDFIAKKWKEL